MAGLHQFPADITILAGAVGGGGRHNESGAAVLVQITVEIGDPEIVGVADFLVFIHARHAERQPPGALARFGFHLVHVERRVGHHIIAAADKSVRVVIKGVGLVAGADHAGQSMHRHVHLAELRIILHLFLSIERHGAVGVHARLIDKIAGLDEHAAAAAGRVKQHAALGFQHVDDHFYQRFGREKHTVIRGDVLGKFIEEVFVDTPDNIAADFVERAVIENAEQLGENFVGEIGIGFRQHTGELLALFLDQGHGIVHHFAEAVHGVSVFILDPGFRNVFRQTQQIAVLRFPREKERAFRHKIVGLHGHHAAAAGRTVFQYLFFHQLETAVGVSKKNQPEYRHAVLVGCQLGAGAQKVGGFPEIGFQFADIYHVVHLYLSLKCPPYVPQTDGFIIFYYIVCSQKRQRSSIKIPLPKQRDHFIFISSSANEAGRGCGRRGR